MAISKRTILSLILSVTTIASFAQSTLTGKVIDSETGEALIASTVRVMSTDTTRMIAGNATTKDGAFTIKSVKDGNYILKVSYVGYRDFFRSINVQRKANKGNISIGTILMKQNSIQLNQAVVTGELKEMEVKDDTLIFNADAFKVPEGSVLEDLIKKLPGVTIEDGTIKVNGKTVRRILVGGKEFFGNDQNMSMKNLPAEIVDKVKTYDKQSDFSRITGIDDGEEETVLDLTIKKGFQQGWFGNIDAGYGTEKLYSGRLMLNRFSEKMQGNVLGSQNNTGNNGNATARQIGGRLVFDTDKIEFGGNFRFNYNKSHSYTKSSNQNFVRAASYSNSLNSSRNRNNNFNSDFRIEWRIDSLTTLQFQPSISTGKTKSSSGSSSATFNDDPYQNNVKDPLSQHDLISDDIKVNFNESSNWSDGDNYNLSGNLLLNRRLGGGPWFGPSAVTGSNGRNVSIRANGTLSENKNKNYNWSNVTYYQQNGREDLTFRLRNTPSDNKNYSVGLTYSEPILRNLIAQANYNYQYSKRHSDGQTYDFAEDDEKGQEIWDYYERYGSLPPYYQDFLSDSLSRYTDNINKTHNLEFSLRYITSLLNISTGVRVEAQNQKMAYQYQGLDTIASRNISRVSPTLNARLRFSRQHTLRFTYRGNTRQPEMTDLFTLTDQSNPLNIREGNPNLKPSFTHNFNLDYNNYFQATQQSINSSFSYGTTRNSIAQRTEYNEVTGGQRSRPENINGNWNINGTIGFNTPLFWSKLSMNASTDISFNNRVSYLYQNQKTFKNNTKDMSVRERLSITLRLSNFDIRANGNFNYNKTKNRMVTTGNQNTYNFNYGLSSTGNFNNGFGFSTDINMSSRRGYSSANMNTNELIWNAQVSYRFLYRKQATISLQAYDILNRRSNISRNISAESRSDRETNAIYSYVMAHFIWRFNLFGSSSARRDLREMRGFMNEMPMNGGGGFGGGRGGGFGGGGFGGGGGRF
ncbi:MAG: TonB-dependent receptor [Bacteroidaceae bacterium]|nr:TonB-dependent receptor [Prevotellaceae bacterium]MDY5761017.1 TonB-dependent receptor [Bacteroidaceae bacterium]